MSDTDNEGFKILLMAIEAREKVVEPSSISIFLGSDKLMPRRNRACSRDSDMDDFDEFEGKRSFLQNEEGLYICDYCPRKFAERHIYIDHIDLHIHFQNLKYVCEHCQESFVHKKHLNLHVETKHKAKLFPRKLRCRHTKKKKILCKLVTDTGVMNEKNDNQEIDNSTAHDSPISYKI